MKRREAAIQTLTLGLALGVGILIGARACTPEPEVVERVVERRGEVVYRCPEPDAGAPDVAVAQKVEPEERAEKTPRKLPDPPPPQPPHQRRRLLAWARSQADGLIGCRSAKTAPGSVVVTLHFNEADQTLEDVELDTPSNDELDVATLRCMRRRMLDWQPPAKLVAGRREVVFALEL